MRLKVGDTILDQFDNTVIAQNYETNNFGDISTRNGGFSNDFTLPLTSKNEGALGFPSDLNIDNRNPYQKVDAQLIDSGSVVAIGYLRYKIVTATEKTIQCSFFADNTEWFNLIKDKNMVDLDLSDYDHEWDRAVIKTAIDADKSSGYTYPLIDYGWFKNEPLATSGTTTLIYTGSMFPCMFVSTLVEQIFKDIGWSVDGELLTDERYTRCIQPFSAEEFVHTQDFIDSGSFTDTEDATPVVVWPTPQSVDWTDAGGTVINVGQDGNYTITVTLNVDVTNCTFSLRKNGTPFGSFSVTSTQTGFDIVFDDSEDFVTTDNIDVLISPNAIGSGCTVNSGDISLDYTATVSVGEEIQMSATMPDITQADFLKYIFFSFGVVPQPDNYSKTISLDFFRTIEDNIPNALDWSEKLDISKTISTDFTQLLNNYSRVSKVLYEEDDDDDELVAYKAETKRVFGDGQLDIDNEHLDPEKDIYTAPYTSMININSFENSLYIPQIKYFIEDPENPGEYIKEFNPSPKIGLLSENISYETLTLGQADGIGITNSPSLLPPASGVTDISFCWFVKTNYIAETDALDYSLAYDPTAFTNENGSTLLDTYVSDYEDVLNDMKYVKAFFRLNEVDISNLNFLIPVYIDRFKSYFYVNKVKNYQGATKTTEVELIKLSNG